MKLKCPKCKNATIQMVGEAHYINGKIQSAYNILKCLCGWKALTSDIVWITRTREAMRLEDISDDHLVNILNYLQKKAKIEYEADVAKFYAATDPIDNAVYYGEEESLLERNPSDYLPYVYKRLYRESQRRNLKV